MHFPIRTFIGVLAAASLLPIAQASMTGDVLNGVNMWQNVLDEQTVEGRQQQTDQVFWNTKTLFPAQSAQSSSAVGIIEEDKNKRVGEFLNVQIEGATHVLSDVPLNTWYTPYVRSIAEKGIVSGYRDTTGALTGKFGPADNVTVEQMAKVMVSMIGLSPSDCSKPTINATASGSWSAGYTACAEKKSWSLYADGSVDVHRNATRAEVVVTLLQAYAVQPDVGTGSTFKDVSQTSQYASMIEKARASGIISGYTDANGNPNNLFGPNDPVTRAEFAKIVTLGIQVYGH